MIAQRALDLIFSINNTQGSKGIPKLKLDNIRSGNQSSHITISISGFFSEDIEKINQWEGLNNHFKHGLPDIMDSSTAIYSLTYESTTTT